MDCKDLMIGDWVMNACNTPRKVYELVQEQVTYELEGGGLNTTHCNQLYPIPLTEEILVKNGFERCDYNNKYLIINDVINLITPKWRGETEYYACAWYQEEFYDLVQHIEICKCAYVHQMQHLLRLCGIEKEIEL